MNYKKLIGYYIDTNQYSSDKIENEIQAKQVIARVISVYSEEQLKFIKLANNCFSAWTRQGISLHDFLKSK